MTNIRIVLVEPTHPGNIGATARAMKNMGLSSLALVNPKEFPHRDATTRASGADDILAKANIVTNLSDALAGCEKIYGTSARARRLEWPLCTPKEAAVNIASMSDDAQVAIVFGRESSGLTNDELALCHYHVCIPTSGEFSSLNLAAAVQVIVYECFAATFNPIVKIDREEPLADNTELKGFLDHLYSLMIDVEFLNPAQPKKLTQRIQRLFARSELSKTEVNILRGFLSAIDNKIK